MTDDNRTGAQNASRPRPWHAMTIEETLTALHTREQGLSSDETGERLEQHGPNELPRNQGPGRLKRFLNQFRNVLIFILLIAALFTAFLGEWTDTAVILAVVIINAVVGFVQEGKAEKALESIRAMLSVSTVVRRDGHESEINVNELVPGDVVLLKSGDRVPADLRVLKSRNAQVEEAALTGESQPVNKQTAPVEKDASLGDRKSMAYSGTMLASGRLTGVVVATGKKTEIGRISELVSGVENLGTPLLRKIDRFS
ncbi:MAG: HAD-IC family P-type ATPase, partial [Desulfomonilia bacterium]